MRTHVILAACATCQGWASGRGPENGSNGSAASEFPDRTSSIVFYTSKIHVLVFQIAPLVSRSTFPKLLPFGISFDAKIFHFAKNMGRNCQLDATISCVSFSFWMQNTKVGCDLWGSLWVVPFPSGVTFWAFKSVHFADANPDSRLAILLGSPGVPNWSSATLNHDSSLAIWTSKAAILQMLITKVA